MNGDALHLFDPYKNLMQNQNYQRSWTIKYNLQTSTKVCMSTIEDPEWLILKK